MNLASINTELAMLFRACLSIYFCHTRSVHAEEVHDWPRGCALMNILELIQVENVRCYESFLLSWLAVPNNVVKEPCDLEAIQDVLTTRARDCMHACGIGTFDDQQLLANHHQIYAIVVRDQCFDALQQRQPFPPYGNCNDVLRLIDDVDNVRCIVACDPRSYDAVRLSKDYIARAF